MSTALFDSDREVKSDIAEEALARSGRLRLRVTGGSMLPALWPGDVVTVHTVRLGELNRGEIVLFRRDAWLCVHRIVRSGPNAIVTRGDAVAEDDGPLRPEQVLGRVATVTRGRNERVPKPKLNCLQRCVTILLHRSDRSRSVLLRCHAARLRLARSW